jgi:hypothetical protein
MTQAVSNWKDTVMMISTQAEEPFSYMLYFLDIDFDKIDLVPPGPPEI